MKDLRSRNPVGGQAVHPLPREAILLATPTQRAQPDALHIIVECSQRSAIGWHCMVAEETSDHLLDPSPLLGDLTMLSPSQLLLDLPERRPHAIAPCDPLHEELPTAVAFTDEGKAEEVEGLRLAEPTLRRRSAAKRPNSIRRVLSGLSDSENSSNRLRISSQNRRASASCSKPTTMSSAYRMRIMSPVASCRRQRAAQRSNT